MDHPISKFLRDARNNVDMTQRDVVDFINPRDERNNVDKTQIDDAELIKPTISIAALKQYERGRVIPNLKTTFLLCDVYDADWNELWDVLESHVFEYECFRYGKMVSPPLKRPPTSLGRPATQTARQRNGNIGEQIVVTRLTNLGLSVSNMNDLHPNHPNYDLEARCGEKIIRIQVRAKKHKTKANLCGKWSADLPTFNRSSNVEPADFVVMVRFSDIDDECFVMTAEEAEKKANWFAEHIIALGNETIQFQPYVSKTPRKSRFGFNNREVWDPFAEAWDQLDLPASDSKLA